MAITARIITTMKAITNPTMRASGLLSLTMGGGSDGDTVAMGPPSEGGTGPPSEGRTGPPSEGETGPPSEGGTGVSVAIGIGVGDGRAEKTLVVPIEGVEIVVVGSTIPGVEDGQPVIATERKRELNKFLTK